MGWVWSDESSAAAGVDDLTDRTLGGSAGDGQCSTTKVVRSQCKTEEVEPGKFVKKCEKTEEVLRSCIGKPAEVVHSNKEYTEEDVTDQMLNRPSLPKQFQEDPFNFPGLRSDMDAIERQFFSGIKGFFDAAEEMRSNFFDIFREHSSAPSTRRRVPFEDRPQVEANRNDDNTPGRAGFSGHIDLSGLAKDV